MCCTPPTPALLITFARVDHYFKANSFSLQDLSTQALKECKLSKKTLQHRGGELKNKVTDIYVLIDD